MKIPYNLSGALGSKLKTDEMLSCHTTFHIGGPADYFYEVTTRDELVKSILAARKSHTPYILVGGGSNILVSDTGFRGLVIKNNSRNITLRGMKGEMTKSGKSGLVYVDADSGVPMNQFVRYSIEESLAGVHMHLGLPGTVGGAVYMNAKWMHPPSFVGDAVYQGVVLSEDNSVHVVPQTYFHFKYGYSILQDTRDIVLGIVFSLKREEKDKLWKIANNTIAYRRETQPQGQFSAGCIFKNITRSDAISHSTPEFTTSAGFLIDHAGLTGVSHGDAQISPVHANFIINNGKASARDVIELIQRTKNTVKQQFGVDLKEEIIRVGEF